MNHNDQPWGEAFDRVRAWFLGRELCERFFPGRWSTWDCPECAQPTPAGNPDGEAEVCCVCPWCGHIWRQPAPEWMLAKETT